MQKNIKSLIYEQLRKRSLKLVLDLKKGNLSEYQFSFEKAMEDAVFQTLILQEFQNKGEIQHLYFSFLLSNSLSGETLMKIDRGENWGQRMSMKLTAIGMIKIDLIILTKMYSILKRN